MKNIYDKNNEHIDAQDADNENEFEGYGVVEVDNNFNENEVESPNTKAKKEEENFDDGETVEASEIPQNEQTVLIDNPKVTGVAVGALLHLQIKSQNSISVLDGSKKVGELKPAYSEKLFNTRAGQHTECSLHSKDSLVMIKIKFYARARKNTVKLALPQ